MKNEEKIQYPIRINRYLFLMGYCSRRKADKFIESKHVKINGRVAVLGDKVQEKDKVEVDNTVKEDVKKYVYIAFNKPTGIVSHNPQKGEKGIEDILKLRAGQPACPVGRPAYWTGRPGRLTNNLSPLGRLDKASEGLMILSNDGRIVDKLLNPKYEHEKEYVVKVDKNITGVFLKNMEAGVKIERYKTKPTEIEKISGQVFKIILKEGKKHQIRRMCAALGYQVQNLKRIRIANIKLGTLKPRQHRLLGGDELKLFLKHLL